MKKKVRKIKTKPAVPEEPVAGMFGAPFEQRRDIMAGRLDPLDVFAHIQDHYDRMALAENAKGGDPKKIAEYLDKAREARELAAPYQRQYLH